MVGNKGCNQIVYATLLCAILGVAWAAELAFQIPVDVTLQLRQYAETCGQEFGVDSKSLKKLVDRTLPNDDASKGFMHCVFLGSGYVDKNGKIMVEKMKQAKVTKGTMDDIVRVTDECNKKISLAVPMESTYEMNHCVLDSFDVTVST